jgi:hypothetical protein
MSKADAGGAENERLTPAGCVLAALSFAVTLVLAVPIVMWRDSDGRPLPRVVAICAPLLIGAVFHGIGTAILWVFGLKVLSKPEKEKSDWTEL